MRRFIPLIALALASASCGTSTDSGPVKVAIIGQPESLVQQGVRLSPAAQAVRSATHEGLVALDPGGQVVPAIAERWIVTDDGASYIFRLRNTQWPGGEAMTAREIELLLKDNIARLRGTSLGLDLSKITSIRAMTGRVIEIRLASPMPEFLRLLAQPELGFVKDGGGAGPMTAERDEESGAVRLSSVPPETRGLPPREDWEEQAREIEVRALPAQRAVAAFRDGEVDLVLDGTLTDFPLAQVGPLSRGAIQVDPAQGLLGIVFRNDNGVLGDAARREALSMALDRQELIQPFGIGGWQPTTWIVPQTQFASPTGPENRWQDIDIDQRRAIAARRIGEWKVASGNDAVLRIGLPPGTGSDLLFRQLDAAWSRIGIELVRVEPGAAADLELRDRLARYSSPRWFLNQFNCGLEVGLCSPEADEIVREALTIADPDEKERAYAEAQRALIAEEVFIPIGAPVRWSLVRASLSSYLANQWGLHPLFPLSQPTT